jgi:hypothetical protein
MTYSEIHAENVRSRDENQGSEEGYGRIHRMQLQAQNDWGKKRDTGSFDKRNTASLPLYPSSDSNQTQSIDTQSKAEQMNALENDSYYEVVEWFGPGKRFYEAKGQRRPTPYHTNALDGPRGSQLATTDSKSVSRESSALKNILIKKLEAPLQLLKAFSASSFSLLKNDKASGVKGGAASKRNPRDDDQIQSERSKQRNSHIYDGGSIIELADDDSYCAHYDRIQSSKQAQKQGRGQGRSREGNTPAAGFSVLQTERSAIRKRRAPTSNLTDTTANSKSKQQDFFGIMSQSSSHIKEDNRYTEKSDQKEKVKFLENSILEHISGRLGNLRHSLNKMDFSRSGVLNYEEFKSVIAQRGVNMLPRDVEKVFQDRATDSRDKGPINEGGVTSHDLRYSRGLAVNIQQYIEHLSEREKERIEVLPRERSSAKECLSDRLKFVKKDFLFQKKYDDQRLLQNGNTTHANQRNEATTSSSRSKYCKVHFCTLLYVQIVWHDLYSYVIRNKVSVMLQLSLLSYYSHQITLQHHTIYQYVLFMMIRQDNPPPYPSLSRI